MCHDLALKNPQFDATRPISGKRCSFPIINVGPQCMKRHAPSRYHSVRAISAPPKRPAQLIRTPNAPSLIADCTACFIARRNPTRRSSCWAIFSATSFASISGLRTSTIFRLTSPPIRRQIRAQLFNILTFLPNDQTETTSVDCYARPTSRPLNHHAANGGLL